MSQFVFVPGLLCTGALFTQQVAALEGRASCHIADTRGMDSISAMAEKCLSDIDGEFALLGFSMGGYVAIEVARQAPERVRGLALVSTMAKPDTEEKRAQRQGLVELSQIGKFKGVTPRLLPRFFSKSALADESKTQIAIQMGEEVGKDNFILQQSAIMARRDGRSTLEHFDKPSIVICGTEDVLTPPEESVEMAELLPNSQLHLLEGIGHMSTIEAPDTISDLLVEWYDGLAD